MIVVFRGDIARSDRKARYTISNVMKCHSSFMLHVWPQLPASSRTIAIMYKSWSHQDKETCRQIYDDVLEIDRTDQVHALAESITLCSERFAECAALVVRYDCMWKACDMWSRLLQSNESSIYVPWIEYTPGPENGTRVPDVMHFIPRGHLHTASAALRTYDQMWHGTYIQNNGRRVRTEALKRPPNLHYLHLVVSVGNLLTDRFTSSTQPNAPTSNNPFMYLIGRPYMGKPL